MFLYSYLFLDLPDYPTPRGVMVKVMVCEIAAREFELQSRYYVHFWTNTLGKGTNPSYGLHSTTTTSRRMACGIK